MMVTLRFTDPYTIPLRILVVKRNIMVFDILMKIEGTVVVNRVMPRCTPTPLTPNLKSIFIKRKQSQTCDMSDY